MYAAAIRLFKAIPVQYYGDTYADKELNRNSLAKGFVFDPTAAAHLLWNAGSVNLRTAVSLVDEAYGRDPEKLNQAFHKSFRKVKDAPIEQLLFEQIVHYFTTYGAEAFGVYDQNRVFVPAEQLDVPELKEDIPVVVIRGLTKEDLKTELLTLLSSGIALDEQSVKDAVQIADGVGMSHDDLSQIANKEVSAALYRGLEIVPENPVEFLRYLVYLATGKTLLIKSPAAIAEIKAGVNDEVHRAFVRYDAGVGFQRLGEIFHRFKPIFLAFRSHPEFKHGINRIRRHANRNHKPMQADLLNDLTAMLARGEYPALKQLTEALANANTFRLIRLAYALQFRAVENESVVYRIRNGKSFATDFSYARPELARDVLAWVLGEIRRRVTANVSGKKVFIPAGVQYALPSSQKQFTGNIPSGTSVTVETDMVAGIHWTNTDHRNDLDLSLLNKNGKIGWDGQYRDQKNGIFFSGDNTDAPKPKGASEAFSVDSGARGEWLLLVNLFSGGEDIPFKIFVASNDRFGHNYIVDPNKIIAYANSSVTHETRQKILGVVVADDESTRFYFGESTSGRGITAGRSEHAQHALNYLVNSNKDSLVLNGLLTEAGAELVDDPAEADIDLSLEAVDKNSFLDLLT